MRKSNKILAVLMALVMIITAVPMMTAMAAEEHVHTYKVVGDKDATCTEPGFVKYECTDKDCKDVFVAPVEMVEHKLVGSIKKNNAETHRQICDTCDGWITAEHNWKDVKVNKEATCKESGSKDVKCNDCGETKTVVVPVKAHTYTSIASGDITDTQHMGVCTVCNDTVPEAHKWDDGVVTTKPQCGKAGVLTKTCTVCKATTTEPIAKAHTLPEKAKSVDDETHKYTCSVAGCGYDEFTPAELAAAGKSDKHDFVVVAGEKSACGDSVALTVTCKDCDYKLTTAKVNHKFGDVTKEDDKNHKQTCSACGVVQLVAHTLEEKVTKEATCAEAGTKEVACKECDYKNTVEIPATGEHTWGEWVVETPATPTAEGKKYRECSVCKAKEEGTVKYEETAGDVNLNGEVTAVDARIVLQYVAGIRTELSEKEFKAADMDGNGEVTAVDARRILRKVAKLD